MDPPPKLNREKFTLFILYIFMVGSLVYDVTYGRYHLRLYFKAVRRTEGVTRTRYRYIYESCLSVKMQPEIDTLYSLK